MDYNYYQSSAFLLLPRLSLSLELINYTGPTWCETQTHELVTRDRLDGSRIWLLGPSLPINLSISEWQIKLLDQQHIIDQWLFFSPVSAINHGEIVLCYYYSKYLFALWQNISNLCQEMGMDHMFVNISHDESWVKEFPSQFTAASSLLVQSNLLLRVLPSVTKSRYCSEAWKSKRRTGQERFLELAKDH